MLSLIACVDKNYGIGKDGGMPWSFKEDFEWFQSHTTGYCLFGVNTYSGLPNGARNRIGKNAIVLVRNGIYGRELDILRSRLGWHRHNFSIVYDYALEALCGGPNDIVVCGGGKIYKKVLSRVPVDKVILTRIAKEYDCDTFFPKEYMHWYDLESGQGCNIVDRRTNKPESVGFSIYRRKDLR